MITQFFPFLSINLDDSQTAISGSFRRLNLSWLTISTCSYHVARQVASRRRTPDYAIFMSGIAQAQFKA
jgi:hypothetical protein